jgi:hypothetical protein
LKRRTPGGADGRQLIENVFDPARARKSRPDRNDRQAPPIQVRLHVRTGNDDVLRRRRPRLLLKSMDRLSSTGPLGVLTSVGAPLSAARPAQRWCAHKVGANQKRRAEQALTITSHEKSLLIA